MEYDLNCFTKVGQIYCVSISVGHVDFDIKFYSNTDKSINVCQSLNLLLIPLEIFVTNFDPIIDDFNSPMIV